MLLQLPPRAEAIQPARGPSRIAVICRNSSISGDVVYQVLDSENGRGRRMARPRHAASRPCRGLPLVARHHRTIAMHAPTCLRLFHAFPLMRTPLPDLGGTGFL